MMATIDHPVRIEPGTSDDLEAVMDVMEAAFGTQFGEAWTRSQCAGILPMAGVSLMLARDGNGAAGFSLFRSVAGEAELLLLAVAPSHRRRGIGRGLLSNFLERARALGVSRVHLEVRDGNPAIEMYRAAGFSPIGRRRNYYHAQDGHQFDALTFALDL
ncbi:MAG TPA: GNAT family N-acetyltransferase [Sphingomicrobium sp.]